MQRILSYRYFPLDIFIKRRKQIKIKFIFDDKYLLDKYYSIILIQIYKIVLNKFIHLSLASLVQMCCDVWYRAMISDIY